MHIHKKRHILLVSPKTPPSYWGGQWSTWFVGCRAAHIPLPLITVAALLPSEWELKLVDMNVERLRKKDILRADAVLLTGMIIQKDCMAGVIKRCREAGIPVVVGGPFVSTSPEAAELAGAASLVTGEAEDPRLISQLVSDLESGLLKPRYAASGFPDMSASPVPRFDLLRLKAYTAWSLQATRGCPNQCEFCNVRQLYGRRPRCKSPEQIVAELCAIRKTGYRGSVFFVDDNFIGNKRAARAILQAVERWQAENGRPFQFYTEADIRLANEDEFVELMVRAGFFAVFQGFESPSKESLKEASKLQNLRIDPVKAARKLREKGLLVYGGFIEGIDADGPDIFDRVRQMIDDCRIAVAMAGMLIAIPGTPLEKRLKREGRLLDQAGSDNFEASNIMPKGMSRLDLIRGYRELLTKLYGPKQYFDRAFAALAEWKRQAAARVTFRECLSVPLSIFWQGIVSRYRRHYWRFMLRTLLRHPKKLAQAFTAAMYAHHFFVYTRKVVIPRLCEAEAKLLAAGSPVSAAP
jgi:radical SAM superfamily enzyme YgiQ (UPF0313 family)